MSVGEEAPRTARPPEGRTSKVRLVALVVLVVGIGIFGYFAYTSGVLLGSSTSNQQTSTQPGGPSLMEATCSSVKDITNGTATVPHTAVGGNGSHAYFLIVETDPPSPYAGINGSYFVSTTTQWPTMEVKLGQVVSIHVINCASSEPHGFQINYYDDKSVIVVPTGQSYNVTFTANKAGTFRIYCDIFCAIHPFMQNGALVVS
jgi:heme/copper-type cytochrome/quinol oxidase subunit 2